MEIKTDRTYTLTLSHEELQELYALVRTPITNKFEIKIAEILYPKPHLGKPPSPDWIKEQTKKIFDTPKLTTCGCTSKGACYDCR